MIRSKKLFLSLLCTLMVASSIQAPQNHNQYQYQCPTLTAICTYGCLALWALIHALPKEQPNLAVQKSQKNINDNKPKQPLSKKPN
jgi:hypothetical protein